MGHRAWRYSEKGGKGEKGEKGKVKTAGSGQLAALGTRH
jgi:hypothetical protein